MATMSRCFTPPAWAAARSSRCSPGASSPRCWIFSLVEVSNHGLGSVVSAGSDRLEQAGKHGVPQIVAPGGVTVVDMQSFSIPERMREREIYAHNRLISCAILTTEEKTEAARTIASKLNRATGPTALILPRKGLDEWDREGGPFHDPEGLAAFRGCPRGIDRARARLPPTRLSHQRSRVRTQSTGCFRPLVGERVDPRGRAVMSLYYLQKFYL